LGTTLAITIVQKIAKKNGNSTAIANFPSYFHIFKYVPGCIYGEEYHLLALRFSIEALVAKLTEVLISKRQPLNADP